MEAFETPARTIFRNGGYDPSEIMARLAFEAPDMGFDVIGNCIVHMGEAGIFDSVQVVKTSVRNAVSTAALALTIDSLVHVARPELVTNAQ